MWKYKYLFCIRVTFPHDLFKGLLKCTYSKINEIRLRALNSYTNGKVKQKYRCENCGTFTTATGLLTIHSLQGA